MQRTKFIKLFAILMVGEAGDVSTSLFGQAGVVAAEHRPIAAAAPLHVSGPGPQSEIIVLPAAVILNGIANLDYKCALLTIQIAGQQRMSVVLKEGESKASVQVLQINTTNARVLVRIGEEARLLSLSGLESPATPASDLDHISIVAVTDTDER